MKKLLFLLLFIPFYSFGSGPATYTISQTSDASGHWYSGCACMGGQSFLVTDAGYITEIKFYSHVDEGITTLTLYAGETTSGPELHSVEFAAAASGWTTIPIAPAVPVCNGMYTFTLSDLYGAVQNLFDPYPNGQGIFFGNFTSSMDMMFEVSITTEAQPFITSSYTNISVCEGIPISPQSLTFTAFDVTSCTVSFQSSDPVLIPVANINASGGNGTYTVTTNAVPGITGTSTVSILVTDLKGCVSSASFDVSVNPYPIVGAGANSTLLCENEFLTLTGTGASTYTWDNSVVDGTPFIQPVGTTTYNVVGTDANGCSSNSNIIVTVNALPTVSLSSFTNTCFSVEPFQLTGGLPSGGSFSGSNISNDTIYPASLSGTQSITYTYTDVNGCTNSATQNLFVETGATINGTILSGGSPITAGDVYLLAYNTAEIMDTVAIINLSGTASFSFNNISQGSYILFAKPAITNNNGAYNGDVLFWQNAPVITVNCTEIQSITINTTVNVPVTGTATIAGGVFEGQFFGSGKTDTQGDPIPGVDVSLEQNPGGIIISNTQTDSQGLYSFANVPNGTFTVLADIPGIGMVSEHTVNVNPGDDWVDLNYFVDSNKIYIDPVTIPSLVGIKNISTNKVIASIYPNPSNGVFVVNFNSSELKECSIDITNSLGQKVYENNLVLDKNSTRISKEIDLHEQAKGVYFIKIFAKNELYTGTIVID